LSADPERTKCIGDASLDYAQRLYADIVDWYKVAETKAQIVLTLDGLFTSVITGLLFVNPNDAQDTFRHFGFETWTLLALMALTLSLSIVSALLCLTMRIMSLRELEARYGSMRSTANAGTADPSARADLLWFLRAVQALPEETYVQMPAGISAGDLTKGLLRQNKVLVDRVLFAKQMWVNWAFRFAATTLLLLLGAGISYVIRIS
jgi:hypothetical protein